MTSFMSYEGYTYLSLYDLNFHVNKSNSVKLRSHLTFVTFLFFSFYLFSVKIKFNSWDYLYSKYQFSKPKLPFVISDFINNSFSQTSHQQFNQAMESSKQSRIAAGQSMEGG